MDSTTLTKRTALTAPRLIAAFILLLSSALFFSALPRLYATLNHIAIDSALSRLNSNKAIANEQLPTLIAISKANLSVNDNAHYWQDSGMLQLYQAQKQTSHDALPQARQSMEQSVARSPANAYLWYRLAVVYILQHQAPEKIAKALLMSIMTGPNELGYLLPRLNLCVLFFKQFSKDDLDAVREQTLIAWKLSPDLFTSTFADDKKSMAIISLLLKDKYPSVLKEIIDKRS